MIISSLTTGEIRQIQIEESFHKPIHLTVPFLNFLDSLTGIKQALGL